MRKKYTIYLSSCGTVNWQLKWLHSWKKSHKSEFCRRIFWTELVIWALQICIVSSCFVVGDTNSHFHRCSKSSHSTLVIIIRNCSNFHIYCVDPTRNWMGFFCKYGSLFEIGSNIYFYNAYYYMYINNDKDLICIN